MIIITANPAYIATKGHYYKINIQSTSIDYTHLKHILVYDKF